MERSDNQRPQGELLHQEKHRIPVNLTVIFALVVAVWGVISANVVLIIAGLGVGAFSWFTNPRRYLIFSDALVIAYGAPRVRIIPFTNISRLELLTLAINDRLRVWLTSGKRVILMARNPEGFRDRLQEALDSYYHEHPETRPPA